MYTGSRFRTVIYALPLVLWLLPGSSPSAAECEAGVPNSTSYFSMLDTLMSKPCFREQTENSELGVHVIQILDAQDILSIPDKTNQALTAIGIYITENYDRQNQLQTEYTNFLSNALLALQQSIGERPDNPEANLKRNWQFPRLDRPPRAFRDQDGLVIDFARLLPADRCARIGDRNCEAELEFAIRLIRVVQLVNRSIDTYTARYRGDVLADRKLRRNKWDSYYDDLTFQFPWELWANGKLLEWTDDRELRDGNLLGFRKLPTSKLVLLHPEVNLVYAQDTESEFDTALSFEFLGFENFDFDRQGKVDSSWGVSLMAAYLGEPDGGDSGWTGGLLFKLNGYSLGVTDNHGERAVILNINLSQRLFDVKQEARRYYDEYEEKINAFKTAARR